MGISGPSKNTMPSRLYNAMIAGLEPYTLKGFLWFQGDGNFGKVSGTTNIGARNVQLGLRIQF